MTGLLVAANLLVFAIEVILRKTGMSERALLQIFALRRGDVFAGNVTPLFLHVFAHASFAHLVGNLLALFFFGRLVEHYLGPWRMLGAYVLAAVVSTTLSLSAQYLAPGHPVVPTLGASGAVAGLVALGVLLSPFSITFAMLIPLPLFLVGWMTMAADLLALWYGDKDQVDHPAHLGGYLSVLVYYYALDKRQKKQARMGLMLNLATALLAFTLWRVVKAQ